jgi:predicted DNA-binding transcriptional regulator AlpA
MTGDNEVEFGIERNKIYRKTHKETRKILGLQATAIDDAIADGTLPEPWPLTGHGKVTGWLGEQLIEVQRKRQAAAAQRAAQRAAASTHKKKKR